MANLSADRLAGLNSWYADWRGLRVAVLGLGVTGFSVADTLAELGSEVRVVAGSNDPDRERLLEVIGADFFAGDEEAMLRSLIEFDPHLMVISPGFYPGNPFDAWAVENDVAVWGDIDLAWRVRDKVHAAEWLCVTGTNGKTTTTQLAAHMLLAAGKRVAPVGNIGVPVLDAVRDPAGFDVLVVELSSFQLARVRDIEPHASVCLNIAADHIDWHGSFEQYIADKANVFERTKAACIYNRADDNTLRMVENADVREGARAVSFGLDVPPVSGFGVVEGLLADRGYHQERKTSALEIVTLTELQERGLLQPHTIENILAATALVRSLDIDPAAIREAILGFTPDRHRCELVAVADDVRWVNDSKATNAHAARASLATSESIVWIVGGLLKGVDISELIAKHANRLRAAIVIGAEQTAVTEAFAQMAPDVAVYPIAARAGLPVMLEAVAKAQQLAKAGDTVLLAPAAASMDQFASYADRGEQFVAAVREIVAG
ncbi:UDP-N-acetylmuramoyl-L-alanine--D-glutamate ligase [Canibacter zhoujuaniae]|uniref:UDP-N-acetylmuramoyl-L-alanine--D-glutamate ligase n=1 Tax=Canibacter zhoujuaniae TaxID=2708343 RepID=UPI00141DED0E|nr:UDP-N-acetylmuramoyl-L-alanine--D-glutamate ligase [Canibacter zhoujuaniae]